MEKDNNYLAPVSVEGELAAAGIDTTTRGRSGEGLMLHYMLNDDPMNSDMIIPSYLQQQQQQQRQDEHQVERNLSFADVMQFAESGPKLAQLQHEHQVVESHNLITRSDGDRQFSGVDPVSLLKFPVLGNQLLMQLPSVRDNSCNNPSHNENDDDREGMRGSDFGYMYDNPVQHEFLSNANDENFIDNLSTGDKTIMEGGQLGGRGGETSATDGKSSGNSKRKRPRTIKTSEEVESQRMTHIAVERNRRKQMNEHLRVLRSLMPSSYVQRGDQASIIGGAIEFVRELEQLLQCLESQKRRRLYGDQQVPTMGDSTSSSLALVQQQQPQSPLGVPYPPSFPTNHHHHEEQVQLRLVNDNHPQLDPYSNNNHNCSTSTAVEVVGGGDSCGGSGLLMQEEMAESKSCIADVEVKVLGFDALIKILSRRRPSQLIKAIAALEDLQFSILHTNITTIEQTVLYSFNVKVGSEARFTAEDIANSVQQIFTFIHANTNI